MLTPIWSCRLFVAAFTSSELQFDFALFGPTSRRGAPWMLRAAELPGGLYDVRAAVTVSAGKPVHVALCRVRSLGLANDWIRLQAENTGRAKSVQTWQYPRMAKPVPTDETRKCVADIVCSKHGWE